MKGFLRSILTLGAIGGVLLARPGFAGRPLQEAEDKKSQEAVAAKIKFETIKPDDPAVLKALGPKDVEAATKLAGKEGTFKGTVTKIYVAKNNSLMILDFDEEFRDALAAKLEPEFYSKFPKIKDLRGKTILVKGKFILYKKTHPEIELTDPAQIKIIEDKDKSAEGK